MEEDSEDEDDDEDDDYDEDEEDFATGTKFDLIALEKDQDHKPIFTKALLQRIASEVSAINIQQSQPVSQRTQTTLHFQPPAGPPVKIWEARDNTNSVSVHYKTRVETSPSFQTRFNKALTKSKDLRSLNPNMSEAEFCHNTAPYFLTSWLRMPSDRHKDASTLTRWRTRLSHTQTLWAQSSSCSQMQRIVRSGATRLHRPITKIVCVGLGALDSRPAWYQSALQHMTVFSLAAELDAVNKAKFPAAPAVSIIASDPCYDQLDWILLRGLTSARITFGLSDPETLLAIDGNALVVTAFLPVGMPLMQIVADLWAAKREDGPGLIIGDRMEELSLERKEYCLRNRGSPGVARMLTYGYFASREKIVDMEEDLRRDVKGETGGSYYWLQKMGIWLRKD
ncbi:hypothetical protein BDU57DRAFT_439708 [Ampelomyces quisqualis]|uniref:SRR1-like domain-containing protein n=1 Tax=Ampelomyces quisqualis TaxID=50730 RepID=A0A6A5R3X5_AMPQU|nr:hypothetical protein BDU57DRAFT_439708 [Ampelomyces quisqualis]